MIRFMYKRLREAFGVSVERSKDRVRQTAETDAQVIAGSVIADWNEEPAKFRDQSC